MKDFSYITNSHPSYIDELYSNYKKNPDAIDQEYRKFFDGFDFAVAQQNDNPTVKLAGNDLTKEFAVYQLIADYKKKGHLLSDTNPIRSRRNREPNLEIENFGLSNNDLKSSFQAGQFIGLPNSSLQQILDKLKATYSGKFGIEYTYIRDDKKVEWLEAAIERELNKPLSISEKKHILQKLTESSVFETFLHKKYIGQKRFSLEGGENTITLIDQLITTAADLGAKEVVLGMAHRGRLNVLANILGKTYSQIFSEFEGVTPTDTTMGSGDVKYHMGFSSNIKTKSNKDIYIKLTPNPSHLETVGSVVMGYTRSKTGLLYQKNTKNVLPIIIHGDASIAGQGIVYELLQMSKLDGYEVGGTVHIVINNQIGFTTDFFEARSSDYCTSIAATIQAPVFHVNGDDPETIAKVGRIASAYRQEFGEDIFIDILCYRKHGHNEGDDPKYTQPKLYKLIGKHKPPRETYLEKLSQSSLEEAELGKQMEEKFWKELQTRLDNVKQNPLPYTLQQYEKRWKGIRKATAKDFEKSPATHINKKLFDTLVKELLILPKSFTPLPKIATLLADKLKKYKKDNSIDWATGELLAYASLLSEGITVRLSGQDVARGTFSHRHAKLLSSDGESIFDRLAQISTKKAEPFIRNSLLSEYAVLGFEYGFSMSTPNGLVIWEAQFGDFANGAQIIIDQYLSTAEEKWGIASNLTLLLPHGYEGQGPEHSNARIERALQLCAQHNMYVTNVTTAANIFHLLRRQVKTAFRKPLINFSPKANLRHPDSSSKATDFYENSFQEFLHDSKTKPKDAERVIICSGKIYFNLDQYRQSNKIKNVAILRLEQLYPFPAQQWESIRKQYKSAKKWLWVQEEPQNMGAFSYLKGVWEGEEITFVSRPASAVTATGFYKQHIIEEDLLLKQAFTL